MAIKEDMRAQLSTKEIPLQNKGRRPESMHNTMQARQSVAPRGNANKLLDSASKRNFYNKNKFYFPLHL